MNFQGFKKTGSDKKSTTFEHPNGSKLIVAHAALDPKTLKKISELPVNKACGGAVQKFAGDPNDPSASEVQSQPQSTEDPSIKAPGKTAFETQYPNAGKKIYDWFNPSPAAVAQTSGQPIPAGQQDDQSAAAPQPGAPSGPMPTNVNIPSAPAEAPSPMEPFKYDPYKGLNMQMAGNNNEAKAIGDLENSKAQSYEQYNNDLQKINYQTQQNAWNNKQQTDLAIQDMKNGHIDPKSYVNNMDTTSKVGTAIGLLLGGIGGALTHTGVNPAMDFLNKQIAHDVDAQKSNMENKKTIFNAMQMQYGNQQDALKMTHAFYLAKMQNQINEAAAKSGNPLAMARAQQLNGPIETQLQQLHYDVGMRQAAMSGLQNGASPAAAIPFLVKNPAEQEKATAALGKIQELNKLHSDMRESAEHLRNQMFNGALSPNDTASAKDAFAGAIQKISEGRYNEDAAHKIVTSMLPQAGDMGSTGQNKDKRMDEFFDAFRQEPSTVLQSHFIPVPKIPPRATRRK